MNPGADLSEKMVTPLQLCLAAQSFYPFYAGGALRFMRYLPGLKEREIQTRVFTGTPNLRKAKASQVKTEWYATPSGQMLPVEMVNGAPVHRFWMPDATPQRRVFQYTWKLAQFCVQPETRPDLIQFLPLPFWSIPALMRLRRAGIPFVYAYNLLGDGITDSHAHLIHRGFRRWQLNMMDCVIVNSRAMADQLSKTGTKTTIRVITNGVDTNRFAPAPTTQTRYTIRQRLGIAPDAPLVVTVGSVEPRKGSDLLLAAWAKVVAAYPQSHLVFVGPRPYLEEPGLAAFRQKLERLVSHSGAAAHIHFVGQVENVEAYLQAADLFVFSSVREGLPNVVLEAMATGLPVITTRFIGLSEELGHPDKHFLAVEQDPDLLGEGIKQLLGNPTLRSRLSGAGRAWVAAEMALGKILDQYAALYRELGVRTK